MDFFYPKDKWFCAPGTEKARRNTESKKNLTLLGIYKTTSTELNSVIRIRIQFKRAEANSDKKEHTESELYFRPPLRKPYLRPLFSSFSLSFAGDTWVHVPGACIKGHNIETEHKVTSFDKCKQLCLEHSSCLSVDYSAQYDVCYLSDQNRASAGDHFLGKCHSPHDYAERVFPGTSLFFSWHPLPSMSSRTLKPDDKEHGAKYYTCPWASSWHDKKHCNMFL